MTINHSKHGVIIAVRAQLPGEYEESIKTVEITKYQDRYKVPTIGLKKLPGWNPPESSGTSTYDFPSPGPPLTEDTSSGGEMASDSTEQEKK